MTRKPYVFLCVFKANDGLPSRESAMAARHTNLSQQIALKREVHQHVKLTRGSNPAPYKHSTRQITTEQDRTKHMLKRRRQTGQTRSW